MSKKILDIYTSILSFAGLHADSDGVIYVQPNKNSDSIQVEINGEPLVLPIHSQFNNPDQKRVYFHPFCENFVRGESEVVQKLREYIAIRFNCVFGITAQYLLSLLGSPEQHKRLDEDQIALLKFISEADDKTAIHWSNLMMKLLKQHLSETYIKLYLKHSGTWRGEAYSRLGIVTFPFYQDLTADKYDHLRVKDRSAFKKIVEFIFPDIKKSESYNYGTRTRVAPYLDALMSTSAIIAQRLNDITTMYKDFIPNYEDSLFDMEWFAAFQDLDDLRSDIEKLPQLVKGNGGRATVSEQNHPIQKVEYKQDPPAPTQTTQQQPIYQQAPQPTQAPQYQAPVVRETADGKLNFTDMLRANPVMAMQPNPMAPILAQEYINNHIRTYGYPPPGVMMPGAPQVQQVPSWAAPQNAPMMNYPGQQPMYPPSQAGYIPAGYQQPVYQQQPQVQLPPPALGHQWVVQNNQYVQVPIQQQAGYQPQPTYMNPNAQQPPPPGWNFK